LLSVTTAADDAFQTANRPVASVQKLASATLCLVALASSVYAALNGVWAVAALFLLGLALALQSYRAVENPTAGL